MMLDGKELPEFVTVFPMPDSASDEAKAQIARLAIDTARHILTSAHCSECCNRLIATQIMGAAAAAAATRHLLDDRDESNRIIRSCQNLFREFLSILDDPEMFVWPDKENA